MDLQISGEYVPIRDKPFACPICNKGYMSKDSVRRHQRMECGKEPRMRCPHCPHITRYKSNLVSHIINRHPESEYANS
ncbi:hypothetical protein GE061_003378 [Apolygus lucorum]|uniref:C2H2-type domain-containing protein n=1 Tax=Apolygus lucorum TaxID=248454 RepID=A0A8S9X1D4_APOLU|nr:hypothetical protein GE061_003378 [Apolygus lucorum]